MFTYTFQNSSYLSPHRHLLWILSPSGMLPTLARASNLVEAQKINPKSANQAERIGFSSRPYATDIYNFCNSLCLESMSAYALKTPCSMNSYKICKLNNWSRAQSRPVGKYCKWIIMVLIYWQHLFKITFPFYNRHSLSHCCFANQRGSIGEGARGRKHRRARDIDRTTTAKNVTWKTVPKALSHASGNNKNSRRIA